MRRMIVVLAAFAALSVFAKESRAQFGNGDPFFLYYGYFLPRQAAIAAQPRVEDTINAQVANQQAYAQTNRANLYDPNGGYGANDPFAAVDPLDPNRRAAAGGGRPASAGVRNRSSVPSSNINGTGPALYFNRKVQYYPSATRTGQGPNRNLAVAGRGIRGGGGMGVPSASPGMAGPR